MKIRLDSIAPLALAALAVSPTVAAGETYRQGALNPPTNRFWKSDYLGDGVGQYHYIILDRLTGCKYLAYGAGYTFAMAPYGDGSGQQDCSGERMTP